MQATCETNTIETVPKLKVLMIEDNRGDFILARTMLAEVETEINYEITWADTLAVGLQVIATGVDAILLDLTLPDSSGWATFEKVKMHSPDIPIILLTGLSDEDMGMRAIHAGAQDYLVKGQINSRLLARTIRYAVERKRTAAQLAAYAQQLRIRNEQLHEDIRMAKEVQQSLLPRKYPPIPPREHSETPWINFAHAYRPCATVGGDFFSVSRISDCQAAILVCDVMGHGMRAALITALLRGVVEELAAVVGDPAAFLAALNRGLKTILSPSGALIFTSALYAVIDLRAASVSYCSAGHAHPVLIRDGGSTVHTLRPDNWQQQPALGINEDQTYALTSAQLQPGDRMLFFTDGICEPEDDQGRPYGSARLLDAIASFAGRPLRESLDALITDAQAFRRTNELDDDICLLGTEILRTGDQT